LVLRDDLEAVAQRHVEQLDHGVVHRVGDGVELLRRAAFEQVDLDERHRVSVRA
jgi:hypothetical protein